MAIQAVAGGAQCGAKRHATEFTGTGPAKGHFPVYVCDRTPEHRGYHHDSTADVTW